MDRREIVDELGLVKENEHIVLYNAPKRTAFVFRVLSRRNRGYEKIDYGPLPLTTKDRLITFEGASVSPPEDGVMPARSYTETGQMFPSLVKDTHDERDMWYAPNDFRDTLFHVKHDISPAFLRVHAQVPINITLTFFQERAPLLIRADFGWNRGQFETVHIPTLHYGWMWGNDTNLDVYTFVRFTYAEMEVETPRDAEVIFDILTQKYPAHWITMPWAKSVPVDVTLAFERVYDFVGFPLYMVTEKDKAIAKYEELLKKVKV